MTLSSVSQSRRAILTSSAQNFDIGLVNKQRIINEYSLSKTISWILYNWCIDEAEIEHSILTIFIDCTLSYFTVFYLVYTYYIANSSQNTISEINLRVNLYIEVFEKK